MATHGAWHRRGLAMVSATSVIGSFTTWVTQVAIATSVSAATVQASPYFAGAVTSASPMHAKIKGVGTLYTESAHVSFIVPTVTCSASQDTTYAVFQDLEGAQGESGYGALYLDCASGTFSAGMFTSAPTGNPTSGGCANVPVAAGDSISFSEQESFLFQQQVIPTGTIEADESDTTNGESSQCSSATASVPSGPVYTGMCDWVVHTTAPVPKGAPLPPPIGGCASAKVSAFSPFSLSGVQVENKPIWQWPTDEYDMYRYRQVGSTLEPIDQVQTQKVENALDFTFLHR
jgi:hypothetical protein